ncbi:ferrochelatase [Chondrinema litorale]|uniref:ferrochelatase n=1 Tax=Chondrinema litorale TaxID=2994555 RepID=UPI002544CA8A|nr:ferrochelatase [Chondrinema litorale]UZR93926.1 ferrochelatase [Chondrinema litorale]
MKKTGVLMVNLGTPDSYEKKDVAKYLNEFLMDGRVIDVSYLMRLFLVKVIIVPFRSGKVSKEYKKLWLENGSPLLVYGKELRKKVSEKFGDDIPVELAMRYQSPSIESGLDNLRRQGVNHIIVFPLFPQYASATTGSVAEKVMDLVSKWNVIPDIQFLNSYHEDSRYISCFAEKLKNDVEKHKPDHVLFSYHGIPERHLDNMNQGTVPYCKRPDCTCSKGDTENSFCYRSSCFQTSNLIAEGAGLPITKYTTSFQSRLGKDPWIKPYTDATIEELAKKGIKNLLVISPSFVADCLETTLEIGEQYKELFEEHGGTTFNYTLSLNAEDKWAEAVYQIISDLLPKTQNSENLNIKKSEHTII